MLKTINHDLIKMKPIKNKNKKEELNNQDAQSSINIKQINQVLPKALTSKLNKENNGCGLALMKKIPNDLIPLVIFDPQYRGVLDKLQYGNEGARQKGRHHLAQMSNEVIIEFLSEINRVLRPSGHLFLWVDKFHLVEGCQSWLNGLDLEIVDLMTWDKGRIGMGYRTRRKSEHIVIIQKKPKRAKGCWLRHDIGDVWCEKALRSGHAHAKPELLQKALIEATTVIGDVVLDPCSGGFSTLRSANSCGRNFLGTSL